MTYIPSNPDKIAFSTYALLGNGATYDSGVISLIGYTQVQTDVLSDVDGTITIDFVRDDAGADILRTLTIPYVGGSGYQMFSAPAFTPYVRYRFTADEAGQTDFYFDTKVLTTAVSPQVLGADAFISPRMVSTLTRSILVGRTLGGESYSNVGITANNNLKTALLEPTTAFGEVKVAEITPVEQIDFVYGINTLKVKTTTTGSGTATGSGGLGIVSTGAATSSSAVIYSGRNLKYRPGQGALVRFTALFTTGAANSVQYAGIGFPDLSDGLFFGYNGTGFGIHTITASSVTTVAQADWNIDTMDGTGGASNPSGQTLDPTKGNVFQIQYQYLGFGALYFSIEDSTTGTFVPVHVIRYANTYTVPSLTNPSMPILWAVQNTTNNTDIVVKGASAMAAVEGKRELLGPRHGYDNTKTTVTTQTNAFTILNCTTFNGKKNGGLVRLRSISYGSNTGGVTSGIVTVRVVKNTTLGGTPSYTPTNGSTSDNGVTITSGNAISSVDTAGTTITGGSVEYNGVIAVGGSGSLDLSDLNIYASPGETVTVSVASTQSCTVGAAVTWSEDL